MRTLDSSQDVEALKRIRSTVSVYRRQGLLISGCRLRGATCYGRRLFRLGFFEAGFADAWAISEGDGAGFTGVFSVSA